MLNDRSAIDDNRLSRLFLGGFIGAVLPKGCRSSAASINPLFRKPRPRIVSFGSSIVAASTGFALGSFIAEGSNAPSDGGRSCKGVD